MRVFALGASLMAMSACSLLWSLDGLEGGSCAGTACVDGAGSDSAWLDAHGDRATGPVDSSTTDDAGRESAPPDTSTNEGGGPGDANDANPACTPPTPPTLDDCAGIVELPAPAVIDGVLDCGVPLWPMPLDGWSGPGVMPATVRAKLGIAWQTGGVYFFVSVTGLGATRYPPPAGDPSWCGDAVELFVDDDGHYQSAPSYDDPGTIQLIADAPSDTMTSTSTGERFRDGSDLGPWSGRYTVVRTGDGFDAEAFVVASDLGLSTWSLAKGGQIGMEVSVDVGDPANQTASCPRLGQFTIQVPVVDASCDEAACNVGEFCTPQLGP